jgi:plasmid stabilization system protein ParE
MVVKWNKIAIKQLFDAVDFIEEAGFQGYAESLEKEILLKIRNLPGNSNLYPLDKYRKNNDGSYYAFEVENYRISYRLRKQEIRIVRIRHTSRKPLSINLTLSPSLSSKIAL